MNRWVALGLLVATGVGLLLRCPGLPRRPMHNDEAVNAIKFGELWTDGRYRYDPNEHHGPTLIYATYTLARLSAAPGFSALSEATLRAVPVVFGIGLILLLPLVVDGLGRRPTIWAGFFTALSPAMVYYSRYYIHELLLVFFTFLALGAGWRYWRTRQPGWMVLAGAALGLMYATKETFVIHVAAAAVGLALNTVWNRWLDASGRPERAPRLSFAHLAIGAAACALVSFVLFSSFFTNASGPLDSLRTYLPWLKRAGGESPHIHAWYFYLHRILYFGGANGPVFTEACIVVLACIGAASGFIRKKLGRANASFVRFLSFYTLALTGAYSVISYKTPWCLLSFLHGMILLAGVGAAVLVRSVRPLAVRLAVAAAIVLGVLHLGWQAWTLSFPLAASPRNPYVYAHTSPDFLRMTQLIDRLVPDLAQRSEIIIKVMARDDDYWPLPWYLRSFPRTGWWSAIPEDPLAPIMICSAAFHARFDERGTHLMVGYFELRPKVFLELYVQKELWVDYLKRNPAPKVDEGDE
jgi:uncharacterized protein (TIGR03663 family)